MAVEFHDFSMEVKAALDDAVKAYLYEAGGELEAQVKRNTPTGGAYFTQQKNAWTYKVDAEKGEAVVGSPLEAALWTEFGTGEYSISPKGGRKGYWVYVKDSNTNLSSSYAYKGGKQYTLQEAKGIVAMMRADGIEAYYTKGQSPKRPLYKAFTSLKPALINRAEQVLKGKLK